jgi:hypothetical protein
MADNKTGAYIAAGVLAVGGIGLVIVALSQGRGGVPGHDFSDPYVPGMPAGTTPTIHLTDLAFFVVAPKIKYAGPGIDAFTYLQVKQPYQGMEVSVMGSGVAGVHLAPASVLTDMNLVSPDQVEPPGFPAQSLGACKWPGCGDPYGCTPGSPGCVFHTPVCGKPAVAGPGYIYLQVYQKDAGDGYSAPTCNKRTLIKQARWACTFV